MEYIIYERDPRRRKLPKCAARHELEPEVGKFFCGDPRVITKHNIVTPTICRHCNVVSLTPPEAYLPFKLPTTPEYTGPCQYLGELLETRECKSCRGNVRVKVFRCGHPEHAETTVKECRDCPDYEPVIAGAESE